MFGKTLTVLFVASIMTVTQVNAFSGGDVIRVFAGLMDGILHKDNLTYLLGCMSGTDALVVDIENAVTHFKQGGTMGIGQGIMDIGKFLQDLPPTCYNCGGIPEDFKALGDFFSIFGNPSLLAQRISYNLLWYYSEINGDIQEALADWDKGLYFEFGFNIGEALVRAIGDEAAYVERTFKPVPAETPVPY